MRPDEELLALASNGDADALGNLLRQLDQELRSRLNGKIGRRYRDAFDECDVLQVTYLEAFLRIGQFAGGTIQSFVAWLSRIAENNLRDAIREVDRAKRPPPSRRIGRGGTKDSYVALLDNLGGSCTTPSQHAARAEVREAIETALAQLPPDYAQVIRLYDLQAKSIADVCASMRRAAGAIHMLKARAHDRLGELLGAETNFFSRPV